MWFFDRIKRMFGKAEPVTPQYDEQEAEKWHDHKSKMMERSLGKEHDMVMHAIIPFAVGGGLDLYYYPNGTIPGIAIATKELSNTATDGSTNDLYTTYEMVMFTRYALDLDAAKDDSTDFGKAHGNINGILNPLARYSAMAKLNPNETSEFPEDFGNGFGGKCFLFDGYVSYSDTLNDNATFGLLAIIEVFRSEMQFAREQGGATLIQKLKDTGHYPYSDLDREPVV